MKHRVRLSLLGILAAHTAGAQESADRHVAEGIWYGAYVDYSPCDLASLLSRDPSATSSTAEIITMVSRCSAIPLLYVLEVSVQGEQAEGTLTVGVAPPMGSPGAMRRLLDGTRIEAPDGSAISGTVAGKRLSVATADEVPVVVEATVQGDRMQAAVSADTGDGVHSQDVRFERCVPESKQSRTDTECSVDALWRRLAEENSGPRRRPSSMSSRGPPLPGSISDLPFPTPLPSCSR